LAEKVTARPFLSYVAEHKHYFISFVIQLALAGFLIHYWDGFVFTTSASQFLHGITPYEIAAQAPSYTFIGGLQQWYAYPPLPLLLFSSSYAPYLFLFGGSPILGRIFIKLTFIVGNLLCAHLVYRFVSGVSSEERAAKAEKMILYNPFLIIIAAVWGMFDIWMVNFLLLTLLSFRRHKFAQAGAYFGLSLLIKPIPIIFAPLLLAHIWNKRGNIVKPVIFAFSAVAVFSLVSLPFLLLSPQGFINQVIGMHLSRPGGGWGLLALERVGATAADWNIIGFSMPSSAIFAFFATLIVLLVLALSLYYCLRKEKNEGHLLASLFVIILVFTLFNKVVSPQYFVIPIVLAVVMMQTYHDYGLFEIKHIRRYYKFLVIPYSVAVFVDSFHFLQFIPSDIAMILFGRPINEVNLQIGSSLPISLTLYRFIPNIILTVLVAPAIVMAAIIVFKSFKIIIPVVSKQASAYLIRIKPAFKRAAMEKGLPILLASFILLMPFAAAAVAQSATAPRSPPPPLAPLGEKAVGVFYYFWENPSYNPETKYGDWLKAGLTPEEGYYTSTVGYIKEDIQQMKDAGIDFAILPVPDYFFERYFDFALESEKAGFRFASLIELEGDETAKEVIGLVDNGLIMKNSPSFLRYDDKPVIFLNGAYHFDPESWADIKQEIERKHGEVFWIWSWTPASGDDDIRAYLETFDDVFIYSPAAVWQTSESPLQYWEEQVSLLHQSSQECNAPTIITAMPYFSDKKQGIEIPLQINGEYSYDRFWKIALENGADILIIASWNEYQTSSAIEPTIEFGDLLLQKTQDWCGGFHAIQ
jgi:disulfide bond formation protein DsbB